MDLLTEEYSGRAQDRPFNGLHFTGYLEIVDKTLSCSWRIMVRELGPFINNNWLMPW